MSIILRVTDELHAQFKEYAQGHSTTMSKILVDYIYTLITKPGKSPAKEKNSVLYCPYCGKDING